MNRDKNIRKESGISDQKGTFRFNQNLDRALLEELYAGDIEYAMTIFEIFLSHSLNELKELRTYLDLGDWTATAQLAHKLKPNFTMVGLPQLEQKMLEIEEMARNRRNVKRVSELFEEVEDMITTYRPIIDADLEKMRQIQKMV